uniref:transposase n=1 Tax=Lentilactobacillus hilgardii TaxID=1588 RepID=UPI00403F5DB3
MASFFCLLGFDEPLEDPFEVPLDGALDGLLEPLEELALELGFDEPLEDPFEIRQDLEASRKRTHPKHIDPYDIFCATLYVLKNGCTWRDLPADFPSSKQWTTLENQPANHAKYNHF